MNHFRATFSVTSSEASYIILNKAKIMCQCAKGRRLNNFTVDEEQF